MNDEKEDEKTDERGKLIVEMPDDPLKPDKNSSSDSNAEISQILHPDYELTRGENDRWFTFSIKDLPQKILWIFYIRTWITSYKREWLKHDIKSGLTVVGMAIPQAIAYTGVIGVSPSLGLTTACIGLSLYPLFGSARHLTIGCSSLTTILTAAILIDFAPINDPHNTESQYTTQVKTLALMAGVFYTALAMFGLGFIATFLAYPVLLGFTGGAALQIASSQIRFCFAISGEGTDLISNLKLLKYLGDTNWRAFACCITTLFVLLSCKGVAKKWPNWKGSFYVKTAPMTLVMVIFFIIVNTGGKFLTHPTSGSWNAGTHKAPEIVGVVNLEFPKSLDIDTRLISKYPNTFLVQAVSMCAVEFTSFYSVAAGYAMKYEYDLIPTRELYSHGLVNLVGSLFGTYPAGGVIVHAPLAEQAGARTLVFNWFSALVVIVAMVLLGSLPHLLYWLPRSVLAGIVWNACIGMFPYERMKELTTIDTRDTYIVIVTFLCTSLWGIFEGIEVGFGFSVLLLLHRTSKPHCQVMGRVPFTSMYGSITTWPDAITTNGIIIFRVDGSLYFGNCNYLKRAVQVLVARNQKHGKPLYYFFLDCHAMNGLDSSGVLALDTIAKYLNMHRIVLILTGLKYPVMKTIKRSHLAELIGPEHFFHSDYHAHMLIYARLRLLRGLPINTDIPFDYIDKKGVNLINFEGVTIEDLEKPLTEAEYAQLTDWDPNKNYARSHPLTVLKKGFELDPPIARFTLASRAETIPFNYPQPLPDVAQASDEGVRVA